MRKFLALLLVLCHTLCASGALAAPTVTASPSGLSVAGQPVTIRLNLDGVALDQSTLKWTGSLQDSSTGQVLDDLLDLPTTPDLKTASPQPTSFTVTPPAAATRGILVIDCSFTDASGTVYPDPSSSQRLGLDHRVASDDVPVLTVTPDPAVTGKPVTITLALGGVPLGAKTPNWTLQHWRVTLEDRGGAIHPLYDTDNGDPLVSSFTVTPSAAGMLWIFNAFEDINGNRETSDGYCAVIDPIPATSITVDPPTLELPVGESADVTATVSPADTTDDVVWSSSSKDIATVDNNGRVTAVAAGTADITATAGTVSKVCKVTVTVPATGVSLSPLPLNLDLTENTSKDLTASLEPADTTETITKVDWTSSAPAFASVTNDGTATTRVTAVAEGGTIVTATATTDKGQVLAASCDVTVVSNVIAVTGITLSPDSLDMKAGDVETLTVVTDPADATEALTVTWSSTSSDIAAVDEDGKVTAIASGDATITATATTDKGLDFTATCAVRVTAADEATITITNPDGSSTTVTVEGDGVTTQTDESGKQIIQVPKGQDVKVTVDTSGGELLNGLEPPAILPDVPGDAGLNTLVDGFGEMDAAMDEPLKQAEEEIGQKAELAKLEGKIDDLEGEMKDYLKQAEEASDDDPESNLKAAGLRSWFKKAAKKISKAAKKVASAAKKVGEGIKKAALAVEKAYQKAKPYLKVGLKIVEMGATVVSLVSAVIPPPVGSAIHSVATAIKITAKVCQLFIKLEESGVIKKIVIKLQDSAKKSNVSALPAPAFAGGGVYLADALDDELGLDLDLTNLDGEEEYVEGEYEWYQKYEPEKKSTMTDEEEDELAEQYLKLRSGIVDTVNKVSEAQYGVSVKDAKVEGDKVSFTAKLDKDVDARIRIIRGAKTVEIPITAGSGRMVYAQTQFTDPATGKELGADRNWLKFDPRGQSGSTTPILRIRLSAPTNQGKIVRASDVSIPKATLSLVENNKNPSGDKNDPSVERPVQFQVASDGSATLDITWELFAAMVRELQGKLQGGAAAAADEDDEDFTHVLHLSVTARNTSNGAEGDTTASVPVVVAQDNTVSGKAHEGCDAGWGALGLALALGALALRRRSCGAY